MDRRTKEYKELQAEIALWDNASAEDFAKWSAKHEVLKGNRYFLK